MFCSKCGKQIPDGSSFCPDCSNPSLSNTDMTHDKTASHVISPPQPLVFNKPISPPQVNEGVISKYWNIFRENRHVDEPNLLQIDFNDQNTLAAMQQIMGNGYYYYLTRFQQIQTYGKADFNFYSLLLGVLHAGYRNVWKAWLEKMKYPSLVCIILNTFWFIYYLLNVDFIDWDNFSIMLDSADTLITIVFLICMVIFASHFDKIYMRHIQEKLLSKDFSPDEDIGRGLIVLALWIIIIDLPMILME